MPLHLLGKKSWNVYNTANIERVRRDEAEAQARGEAEEQRMQEEDAARRIAILRGEDVPPLLEPQQAEDAGQAKRSRHADGEHALPRERKRRRLHGENDTERDIRYAREDAESGEHVRKSLVKHKKDDAPLVDHAGHLQLIPAPDEKAIRKAHKDEEHEAEKAKKRKQKGDEEGTGMRFSDAAGYRSNMQQKPWYASNKLAETKDISSNALVLSNVQENDVWGNEDPLRKERERNRISSSDPFAAMQQAQRQLKQSARDRDAWRKERQAELDELKRADEKRYRREKRRRREDNDVESLDGFSLDAPDDWGRECDRDRKHRHRHHRRRSRSRERSSRRSRER